MKTIVLILICFLSKNIYSQSVEFINPGGGQEGLAHYPEDCNLILDVKNKKTNLYPKNKEEFDDIVYKCRLYTTGQTVKKGAIEGKDKAISVGKKIYEKSGAKSFIDGLLK